MKLALVSCLASLLLCAGCDGKANMGTRPMIRVGIGMTVKELREGSTFSFKDEVPSFQAAPEQKIRYPAPQLHDWTVTQPYDLVYVYRDRELRKSDLGGDNYLIAITTAPASQTIVDHIQVTFQNRALTIDEALTEARMLNDWFVKVGAHPRSPSDIEPGRIVGPFHIEEREPTGAPYSNRIASYQDARAAFLDAGSQLISMMPFELETNDIYVGLEVVNARRRRESVGAEKDEGAAATERVYFLNLSISARPVDRYRDTNGVPAGTLN